MALISKCLAAFDAPVDVPELMQSQMKAFAQQIPLLYILLITNTLALAYTHLEIAPRYLTINIPVACCFATLLRLTWWWRTRHRTFANAEAARTLRGTTILTALLGAGFVSWALALFGYGDAYTQGHVAFYIGITVIGCIFCLMHLRGAALLLTFVVLIPFCGFFLMSGNMVFMAIAMNTILVAAVMIVILQTYYRDFADMIALQQKLMRQHAEMEALNSRNLRLANLDSLTGLPNRRQFFAELERQLARSSTDDTGFAVGVIDLDGFKPVNDLFGHATGDKVLVETGQRLKDLGGDKLFAARLGGDEFGLIVRDTSDENEILALGKAICDTLSLPVPHLDVTAQIGSSIGFALFPEAGFDAGQLFERADYALYHGKKNARGKASIFSETHETELRAFNLVDQTLRTADLHNELELMFQPIVDVERGATIGLEALARWTSPLLGGVAPAVFIKAAERSGMINQLSGILLRKALAAACKWPAGLRLSFNLSTQDLGSHAAALQIAGIAAASGFDLRRIDFEVTETAVMRDFDRARESLALLRAMGAKIALDDFGSGYSSLSYVRSLPLDKIKIDSGFITGIEEDATARNIVKTILDLSRNLNLTCIVEGVETMEQVRILQDTGCMFMQGFHFSHPVAEADVAAFLDAERARMAA